MIMKFFVEAVSPNADGDTVELNILITDGEHEQREKFNVSVEQFSALGLKISGEAQEIERDVFEMAETYSKITSAVKKGIELIAFSQNTKKGLAKKLISRGFEKEICIDAVEYLEKVGYIDEHAQAEMLTTELTERKLYGRERIKNELFKKEFSRDVIDSALDTEIDFDEICAERIKNTIGIEPFIEGGNARKKAFATLLRYGFSFENIKNALEIIKNEL